MIREGVISDYINWIKENSDRNDLLPIYALKTISGGRSGAKICLVEYGKNRTLGILKINEQDEVTACQKAVEIAAENNVVQFVANIIHSCELEKSGKVEYVVLYELAGDDIQPRMLNDLIEDEDVVEYETLKSIVDFLFEWKKSDESFKDITPEEMIKIELGHKYLDVKYQKAYESVGITKRWFYINKKGGFLPNPYIFLQDDSIWKGKELPFNLSISHNDFHGGNVIIRGKTPVVIDFADYRRNSNIFYDLMYLEFHLLFDYYRPDSADKLSIWIELCEALSKSIYDVSMPKCKGASIFRGVIPVLRNILKEKFDWRNSYYHIMLLTAGVSVGLNVMRRTNNVYLRQASFIYASYYLKALLAQRDIDIYEPDPLQCQVWNMEPSTKEAVIKTDSAKNLKFKYSFIPYGSKVSEDSAMEEYKIRENRIFLDIGNTITLGALDLHGSSGGYKISGKEYESTMAMVALMPDLITNNVTPDAEEVEICVHIDPDFDCFASVYTAQYLLLNGKLPDKVELLVQYAEAVDKGEMALNNGSLYVPFTIANVISEVIRNENPDDSDNVNYEKTLKKGVDLIDFCMKRLNQIKQGDISLNNLSILAGTKIFDKEFDIIKNDYSTYLDELEGGTAKQYKIALPEEGYNGIKCVYGLIWDKPSHCYLHKYWARTDINSPDCKGYTFTFIPLFEGERNNEILGRIPVTRVIISVKPDSGTTLKGLGKLLEEAESSKEKELFGDNRNLWRSREDARYKEHWCDNANPWYDGRNHGLTIVDSPGGGSLLTIEEIKEIVLKYADGKIICENT